MLNVFPPAFSLRVSGFWWERCLFVYMDSRVRFWNVFRIFSFSFHCRVFPFDCFSNVHGAVDACSETTTIGLCTDKSVGSPTVYCVTCSGPNIPSAVQDFFSHRCAVHQYCTHQPASKFSSYYRAASGFYTRGATDTYSTPGRLRTLQQCHLHHRRSCRTPSYSLS